MMTDEGRPEPPLNGDEVETLVGYLNYQRATLAWKSGGVDADGMRRRIAASKLTLGGLLKHMAYVEDDWSHRSILGAGKREPWASVDWQANRDWELDSAADDSPAELFAIWERSVARSQEIIDAAIAERGLDGQAAAGWPDEELPSLRWVLVHLIEEYARHNGHADLLREAVDGETGE